MNLTFSKDRHSSQQSDMGNDKCQLTKNRIKSEYLNTRNYAN